MLFLLLHVPQQVALRTSPQHRKLTGIDLRSAELAGMIDADHPLQAGTGGQVAGQCRSHDGLRVGRASEMARKPPSAKLNARFSPAMETGRPGTRKVGASQGLATVAGIRASRSAILPPPKDGAAHSGSGL